MVKDSYMYIYVKVIIIFSLEEKINNNNFTFDFSIYIVHDEVKDKNFELELSWVGEGNKVENCLDGYFGRCKILLF